jgi:hypothetical protein
MERPGGVQLEPWIKTGFLIHGHHCPPVFFFLKFYYSILFEPLRVPSASKREQGGGDPLSPGLKARQRSPEHGFLHAGAVR